MHNGRNSIAPHSAESLVVCRHSGLFLSLYMSKVRNHTHLCALAISQQRLSILQRNQHWLRRSAQPYQETLPTRVVSQAPASLKSAHAANLELMLAQHILYKLCQRLCA